MQGLAPHTAAVFDKIADIKSIATMKMAVLLRRSTFRDYYDIYSILKSGADLREMATVALKYSGHLITTKNLLAMLTDCSRFVVDKKFAELQPRYNVSPKEIEQFIKSRVSNHY